MTVHIVARDCTNGQTDQEMADQLLREEVPHAGTGRNERIQMEKRNAIRRTLASAFRGIHVHTLPCPVKDTALLTAHSLDFKLVIPQFRDKVKAMMALLLPQLDSPPLPAHGDQPLTGTRFVSLAESIIASIRQDPKRQVQQYISAS